MARNFFFATCIFRKLFIISKHSKLTNFAFNKSIHKFKKKDLEKILHNIKRHFLREL